MHVGNQRKSLLDDFRYQRPPASHQPVSRVRADLTIGVDPHLRHQFLATWRTPSPGTAAVRSQAYRNSCMNFSALDSEAEDSWRLCWLGAVRADKELFDRDRA